MAKLSADFANYCCELLGVVGPCIAKRMFRGFGISTGGLTIALVSDLGGGEKLWLKADTDTQAVFEKQGCERFSYSINKNGKAATHSLNYYTAPEDALESPDLMRPWARLSLDSALKARAAKNAPAKAARAGKTQTATPPVKPRTSRAAAPAKKAGSLRKPDNR